MEDKRAVESKNSAISVKDVTKIYRLYDKPIDRLKEAMSITHKNYHRDFYALNGISFDVNKGETVGIIGTNGSGKSTILKIITGVLTPTTGEVEVDGVISALLELGAGFNMDYTGIENIYMNGTMMGFSRKEMEAKLQDILDFADIGDFVYQPVKTYSSGMFVRLAFALAINVEPEILIVDEALSVGDVFFQAKCYRKFEEFKQQGKTILFVSHDLNSISKYCDRVLLLDHGKVVASGVPKEMVDLYKRLLVGQGPEDEEAAKKQAAAEQAIRKEGWITPFEMNPSALEYGDKRAEMLGFLIQDENGLPTNTIEKGSSFTMKVRVRFHEHIEDPIFAFTIKDMRGTEITGTNTMFEHITTPTGENGDTVVVSYTQKADLQGGEYLISFGLTGYRGGDFVVYHRLYDASSLVVVSTKNTVGFYDMNSRITIEQEEKQ